MHSILPRFLLASLTATFVLACSSGNSNSPGTSTVTTGSTDTTSTATTTTTATSTDTTKPVLVDDGSGLDSKYAKLFPIGIALSQANLTAHETDVAENFNHLTAENAMKPSALRTADCGWNTTEADALAKFARDHGWKMTGHTIAWYSQTAPCMFEGLTDGDPASIETLKTRLKEHITYMVERYGDVVDNWDVVNEAISDTPSEQYRTTNNKWYSVFGGPDYIYWAFRYTKEALEAQAPGSAAGKLYYNDYNETLKDSRILIMLDWLENHPEGGIKIDGVGFQAHWRVDWPDVSRIGASMQKMIDAGYKVKVSELDLDVYNDYDNDGQDAVKPFTAELEAQQSERYAALFEMLRSKAADITSVTFWGFADDESWLNNHPVKGRANYPLLWDSSDQPKDALTSIQDF